MKMANVGWGLVLGAAVLAGCGGAGASGPTGQTNTVVNIPVKVENLVSDGSTAGTRAEPALVNAWGITRGPQTPFWISDNRTGQSSIFDSAGTNVRGAVTIPPPTGAATNRKARPTGVTFNTSQTATTSTFKGDVFIFATEDGTIAGWQQTAGDVAVLRVDNSASGAIYTGVAIVGGTLYAANFNTGNIDTWDTNYASAGSFVDGTIPAGFAPFNVANVNDRLYVAYAKQDAQKARDVPGAGNGFIEVFDPNAKTFTRLVTQGPLNSPWGMVLAPSDFGAGSGMLLVGNFGLTDNHINVFDPTTGEQVGQLTQTDGTPLAIDGLWGLAFGNDAAAGSHDTLFFTAGPGAQQRGLFGKIEKP